jgi:hypothetical protein
MRPGGYLSKWEYVLTIEHHNVPPPDGVLNLIVSMDKRPELAAWSWLCRLAGKRFIVCMHEPGGEQPPSSRTALPT